MRHLRIVLRARAIEDLEEIWLYTLKTWSHEQADRYYELIFKEIEYLSSRPESGKNLSHIRPKYRSAKIKSHLIFYKYSSTELDVVRILHENMDIPNQLEE